MNKPAHSHDDDRPSKGEEVGAPSDSNYDDVLLEGHEYDGIREYDNPIPPWLSLIFVGTIIWSVFYVVAINLGYIDRYEERLENDQQEIAALRRKAQADQTKITNALLAKAADTTKRVESGQEIFTSNCAPCHGQKGGGGGKIGPNLTDKYWIHGGELTDIYNTVSNGIEGQMPAWKSQLGREKVVDVVAYVRSIQGTEPANAAEPEGAPYTPDDQGS